MGDINLGGAFIAIGLIGGIIGVIIWNVVVFFARHLSISWIW